MRYVPFRNEYNLTIRSNNIKYSSPYVWTTCHVQHDDRRMKLPEIVDRTWHSVFVQIPQLNDEFDFGAVIIVVQKIPRADEQQPVVDDEIVRLTDGTPCLKTGRTWIAADLEVSITHAHVA